MRKKISAITLSLLLLTTAINAQSFLDLLSSDAVQSVVQDVVETVTGGTSITVDNITGTWNYQSPAVDLEGDSIIDSATGSVVSSQIESKLSEYCAKVGITSSLFSYTFNSDNSFTCSVKGKSLSGTYSVDGSSVTLNFSASSINIGSMTAQASISGSTLSLLFNADKLLSFFTKIVSSSSNSTLSLISSVAEQYDGMLLGFKLSK